MDKIKQNYIAGEWVLGKEYIVNVNPSDLSDVVGLFTQADELQLDNALSAAKQAQPIWEKTPIEKKYSILMAIGNELMARSEELGFLLSREEGKPIAEGKGEVYRAGQFFSYYAAETLRQIGENADSVREGIEIDMRREAIGVVAIISPWNFPMATAAWKIAPALAFGNSVIWKPANLVPASAVALVEIISKHNLPDGTLNLVMGAGSRIGQKLIGSPTIDAISFTGSLEVGQNIARSAVENLTKIQMEMGSKNALLVMDDGDLNLAVTCALGGAFGGTGQKCTASSRLIINEKIHDEFVEKLVIGAKAMIVDHAHKLGTQIGPVVSESQLNQNLEYVSIAKQEGGDILCGGERVERETEGFYMTPAVVINTKNNWRINTEEMFAPITCVQKVSSFDEGVSIINDTKFGLTSGIITKSLACATKFKRSVKAGCVMVNLPTSGTDYHVPFGGRKKSSYGSREQGQYAKEFYTNIKTSYTFSGDPE